MSTESQTNPSEQNFWKIFLLALFFGFLGVHRFVVGKTKTGILQLITFGGLGLWAFVDIVRILLGKFTDGKNQAIANSNPKAAWAVFGGVLLFGIASNGGSGKSDDSKKESPEGGAEKTSEAVSGFKLGKYSFTSGARTSSLLFGADLSCYSELNTDFGYIEKWGTWTLDGRSVVVRWSNLKSQNTVGPKPVLGRDVAYVQNLEFGIDFVKVGSTTYYAIGTTPMPAELIERLKDSAAKKRRESETRAGDEVGGAKVSDTGGEATNKGSIKSEAKSNLQPDWMFKPELLVGKQFLYNSTEFGKGYRDLGYAQGMSTTVINRRLRLEIVSSTQAAITLESYGGFLSKEDKYRTNSLTVTNCQWSIVTSTNTAASKSEIQIIANIPLHQKFSTNYSKSEYVRTIWIVSKDNLPGRYKKEFLITQMTPKEQPGLGIGGKIVGYNSDGMMLVTANNNTSHIPLMFKEYGKELKVINSSDFDSPEHQIGAWSQP